MSYVDVDFTVQPQYVPGYTVEHLKSFQQQKRNFKQYSDYKETYPEKDWKELAANLNAAGGNASLLTRIMNQSNEGSCVGNMAAQACEYLQARCVGKDKVIPISAISMYKMIGSSPNSGANIEDAMNRAQDSGFLPLDTPENRARFGAHVMPHTGFYTKWPTGYKTTMIKFARIEAYIIQNVAEAFSALIKGLLIGVGRAGHSIDYVDPVYPEGSLMFDYVNSWGPWGFGKAGFSAGFGRDSSRLFNEALDYCIAWEAVDPSGYDWIIAV